MTTRKNEIVLWVGLLVVAAIILLLGFKSPLIDDDSTIYAEIAGEMFARHDPWNIVRHGIPWLDKPHFQFWPSYLAFWLFGRGPIQARLPGVLFAFIAVGYVFLIGRTLYSSRVGALASIVLASAVHFWYSANDVRAEIYLAGLGAMAFYHAWQWLNGKGKISHLVIAALAAACAFMTKGAVAILPLASGFVGGWFTHRTHFFWRRLFFLVLLTVFFCTPSLAAYWSQFGINGLRFTLWESQVGRFFNSGPIRTGYTPVASFFHVVLWAFLPWSVLWYAANFRTLLRLGRNHQLPASTATLFFTSIPLFILFNLSQFQYPHYIVALLPFFALQVAAFVIHAEQWDNAWFQRALKLQNILAGTLYVIACVLTVTTWWHPIADIAMLMACAIVLLYLSRENWACDVKLCARAAAAALVFAFVLNDSTFEKLLNRQCSTIIEKFVSKNALNIDHLRLLGWHSNLIDFSLARVIPSITFDDLAREITQTRPLYVISLSTDSAFSIPENLHAKQVLSDETYYSFTHIGHDLIAKFKLFPAQCTLWKLE